ncbi:sigma-70 family RNA polymerase sigma factor [Staphylococcus caeli]|uniref:DNA-binding protein n=1 Tax=Staphylococcus caeli TaxID=2201815 RepID=A0A1D4H8R5_9STAP|nr:sigma-70 family RNA polymerase sigma factor [Staphylococcus caeli]SCS33534.1 DNA-binding protein [Staphylococcus caeli]SCS62170.1 DNA-binding protein [Staphylococcus caeli]
MNFNQLYKTKYKLIHFLLNKYNIKYNYDEFAQLLLIKLWELSLNYDPQKNSSMNTYLYSRLNYYLIDLFRTSSSHSEKYQLTNDIELQQLIMHQPIDEPLQLQHFYSSLSTSDCLWLQLKLQGYKQHELAQILNCSVSTLKNYQKRVQKAYIKFFKTN